MTKFEDEVFKKLKSLVKFYHFKFKVREPAEDIYQDLVCQLISSNYMARYDSSKPLHNYLSGFVFNYYCKVFKREGYPVSRAVSLSQDLGTVDDIIFEDIIKEDKVDLDSEMEIENIFVLLFQKYSFSSFIVYNTDLEVVGVFDKSEYNNYSKNYDYIVFVRAASTVFKMLHLGHSQSEIKDLLQVSKGWVSKIVKRISQLPEVRAFGEEKGFDVSNSNVGCE